MKSFLEQSHAKRRRGSLVLALASVMLAGSFTAAPRLFAASTGEPSHESHATPVAMPGWTQQLKGQTVVENAIEGRAGNAEKMEMQHHRLMQKLEQQGQSAANLRRLQQYVDDASVHGPGWQQFPPHDGFQQRRTGVAVGWDVPLSCSGAEVRCLDDQHRDHLKSLARLLSRLHVRLDG
jgi:hypothetical protein